MNKNGPSTVWVHFFELKMIYFRFLLLAIIGCYSSLPESASAMDRWKEGVGSQIQESACAIHDEDVWQTFSKPEATHTGSLKTDEFYPLRIRLINCRLHDDRQWRSIHMRLDGERVENNIHLFAIAGGESGLAMQIQDAAGDEVTPGMVLFANTFDEALMELHYRMRLIQKEERSQRADWQGAIRLMMTYQ